MKKYVTIDIGGTNIKYGLIDENGSFLNRNSMPTQAHKGGSHILQEVFDIVKTFSSSEKLSGVCISTAGMVDPTSGSIFYSAPLIPNYAGINFKKSIYETFRLPCEVENDVCCAGLAESISGAAKNSSTALILTVGTGIGGCIIIDNKIFHGFSNSACEIGYMLIKESDFQTLGATSILSKKVADLKNSTTEYWNGYRIFEEAKKGDKICINAINEMVDVLGVGIANISYVINPQTIVLGGGIMAQKEYLEKPLRNALDHYLLPAISKHTTLTFAKHKNDAGMLGAFYNFKQKNANQ